MIFSVENTKNVKIKKILRLPLEIRRNSNFLDMIYIKQKKRKLLDLSKIYFACGFSPVGFDTPNPQEKKSRLRNIKAFGNKISDSLKGIHIRNILS